MKDDLPKSSDHGLLQSFIFLSFFLHNATSNRYVHSEHWSGGCRFKSMQVVFLLMRRRRLFDVPWLLATLLLLLVDLVDIDMVMLSFGVCGEKMSVE